MAQELKHVGRVKATNKKCLIAYRTLPGEAHYCLIVPTENLPDIYHDALINLVESNAGQESYEFAEAMDRTQFPDGSRMLPALHATGRLIKVSTGAIEMTPTTGYSLLLSELNQVIAEQRGVSVDDLSLKESLEDKVKESKKVETVTKVEESIQVDEQTTFDSPETEAKYYRSQADKMAKQAAEMRRKAEELVPTKKKV
jgi:alanyl-tRNA synthetase